MTVRDYCTSSEGREALWVRFILCLCIVVGAVLIALFASFIHHDRQLLNRELVVRGRMYFHSMLTMHRWNADYGGVYVEFKGDPAANPHRLNSYFIGVDGTVLVKHDPALMAGEISQILDDAGLLRVSITSLKPKNPANQPDEFERKGLQGFADHEFSELFGEYEDNGSTRFRYMAPLYVEQSCLLCHGMQGYVIGDIRGGMRVDYDITELRQEELRQALQLAGGGSAILVILLGALYTVTRCMQRKLQKTHQAMELMAITDELTGLFNRRYAFRTLTNELMLASRHGTPFGCLMLDIDYFKTVNDTYGHPAGDKVLKDMADIIRGSSRETDVVARFGGEEFMVILSHTGPDGVYAAAEKVRQAVQAFAFHTDKGKELRLTISIGCCSVGFDGEGPLTTEGVIAAADNGLYKAKHAGRNRVECVSLMAAKSDEDAEGGDGGNSPS
ncbi:MAG: diguanylate cyclase [Halodesulfovibrio sp.]